MKKKTDFKIVLKKYRLSDLDELCNLFLDESVLNPLGGTASLKTLNKNKEREWLKKVINNYRKKKPTSFGLKIEYNDRFVGGIGCSKIDFENQNAEVGYWIGKPYWGKGIATESLKEFAKILFKKYNLVRLFALTYDYNLASQKVLEKAGFQFEGLLKKNSKKNNRFYNDKLYSLVR